MAHGASTVGTGCAEELLDAILAVRSPTKESSAAKTAARKVEKPAAVKAAVATVKPATKNGADRPARITARHRAPCRRPREVGSAEDRAKIDSGIPTGTCRKKCPSRCPRLRKTIVWSRSVLASHYWELSSSRSSERKRRLGQFGTAKPILRVFDVTRRHHQHIGGDRQDIDIRRLQNWYIEVQRPTKCTAWISAASRSGTTRDRWSMW